MNEQAKNDTTTSKENFKSPDNPAIIEIEEFSKIDLRVGQIIEAEKIDGSAKLLKLKVNLGEPNLRQIVAGVGKHYGPDELIGRKVTVVSNLKPAKLMGHLSEGMILASTDDAGNMELLSSGNLSPAGSKIS